MIEYFMNSLKKYDKMNIFCSYLPLKAVISVDF